MKCLYHATYEIRSPAVQGLDYRHLGICSWFPSRETPGHYASWLYSTSLLARRQTRRFQNDPEKTLHTSGLLPKQCAWKTVGRAAILIVHGPCPPGSSFTFLDSEIHTFGPRLPFRRAGEKSKEFDAGAYIPPDRDPTLSVRSIAFTGSVSHLKHARCARRKHNHRKRSSQQSSTGQSRIGRIQRRSPSRYCRPC